MTRWTMNGLAMILLVAAGCSEDQGASSSAGIRVHPVTVWGGPLERWVVEDRGGARWTSDGSPSVLVTGPIDLSLQGPEGYLPARLTIEPGDPPEVSCEPGGPGHVALARDPAGTWRVFVGLEHRWFAPSGPPPRQGNRVELFMDGEGFWASVREELAAARDEALIGTWWWQSDFELVRPPGHWQLDEAARREHTVMALLDRMGSAAMRRILVAWFGGGEAEGLAYLNTDPELRDRARRDSGFEAMVQANPTEVPVQEAYPRPAPRWTLGTRLAAMDAYSHLDFGPVTSPEALTTIPAASYHQKFMVLDRKVAFVGGMNVKSTDWDTSAHAVFDPRRMKFRSSLGDRRRVVERRAFPDLGPRKDYGVRVQGPAVGDLVALFSRRWAEARASSAVLAEFTTPFEPAFPEVPEAGEVTLQVVATMPEPYPETSILETNLKAVGNATRYIYIEDQYFRAPTLVDRIMERMAEVPDLVLVVVTKPVSPMDGGKKYTYLDHHRLREAFPDRYLLLQLRSFAMKMDDYEPGPDDLPPMGVFFQDIDVHSKIMLVDDLYLSVGSCNKNDRGYLYEGELDVAILDPGLVAEARDRIVGNLLGDQGLDGAAFREVFDALRERAEANQEVWRRWSARSQDDVTLYEGDRPSGLVYPLDVDDEYLLDVGPDAF